jgi:probable F420-dependent oxidoreductase
MKAGVHIFATDETVGVAELAAEAEARGFESLWLPEHTHIPTSRESEWYRGQELPREYSRTLDPFVALTCAAAATSTLRVGTGICLVAQRDAIVTAKEAATLDLVSAGRFLFGVGLGWNAEEMRDHGVDPVTRRSRAREVVLAMQGLWTEEMFGYQGRFISFEESWLWPKPVQQPWPPLIVGGRGGARAFRDIAAYADGWMPDINMLRISALPGLIEELGDACRAQGRDPVPVTAVGARPDPERLELLGSLGLDRVIFLLPSAPAAAVFSALDDIGAALQATGLAEELVR